MAGKIKYQKCFIAYLDILGFKERVRISQDNKEEVKLLLDSLKICNAFASGSKKVVNDMGGNRTIDIQSRFFSDSVVFFLKDSPDDLGHLFLIVRYVQDQLWSKGLLIRGAITYGDMYFPNKNAENNITLGPGIIKAFELESEIAVYPRIIISSTLYDYIEEKGIQAYPFADDGEVKNYIRQDKDGVYFLDLLNQNIIRKKGEKLQKANNVFSIVWNSDDESKYDTVILNVDRCARDNVSFKNEKIRQKYKWLQSYKESALNGHR